MDEVVLIGNHSTNENDEWYTPVEYIESARAVMGKIDVDPASCDQAQEYIQAKRYYTISDSSLDQAATWNGKVWMNPPYSRVIKDFVNKLCMEYDYGFTDEAIVLTNNGTDTRWFQELSKRASAVCLHRGRIGFIRDGARVDNNNKGQIFTYLGRNPDAFKEEFSKYGEVYVK